MQTCGIGDISEAKILTRLLELGHTVSVPWGQNQRYDLIVDVDGVLLRVQCKTGRLRNGVIVCNIHSCSQAGVKGYKGQIEWFLVYCPQTDTIYKLLESDVGVAVVYLRVNTPKCNKKNIRWAHEYIL